MARDSDEIWGALFVVGAVYLVLRALSGGGTAKTSERMNVPRLGPPPTPARRAREHRPATTVVRVPGFEPDGAVQPHGVCLVCGRHKTECSGHF